MVGEHSRGGSGDDQPGRGEAGSPGGFPVWATIAAGLIALIVLTGCVLLGWADRPDRWGLGLFRQGAGPADPIGPAWLPPAVLVLTYFGSLVVLGPAALAAFGGLTVVGRPLSGRLVLGATASGWALEQLLKWAIDRPRPPLAQRLQRVTSPSFPSGHAMLGTIVWLTVAWALAGGLTNRSARRAVMGTAGALIVLIGLSRLYLGVHYPSDVLAGWCGGASWALLCRRIVFGSPADSADTVSCPATPR